MSVETCKMCGKELLTGYEVQCGLCSWHIAQETRRPQYKPDAAKQPPAGRHNT